MTGTTSQIEWAELIRPRVNAEFDRVAAAFRVVAQRQAELERTGTLAVLEILEQKRREVMANDSAGYFIKTWRELADQVRQMIFADAGYQEIKARRTRSGP